MRESQHPHHLLGPAMARGEALSARRPRLQPTNPLGLEGTAASPGTVAALPCRWEDPAAIPFIDDPDYRFFQATGRFPDDS